MKKTIQMIAMISFLFIGNGCYIYNGMTLASPQYIQRYSIQPKPVNTLRVGYGGGNGFSALEAGEFEHPDLDSSEIANIEWDYSVDEPFILWQGGKRWDLGFGFNHDEKTIGKERWKAWGITMSSMVYHSNLDQWFQHVSLLQFSWLKKGYRATIDFQDWDAIGEEYRLTYSHLFGSNPETYFIHWGGGPVVSLSLIRLKSRLNSNPFIEDFKQKVFPGVRWFISFKTGNMQVGFEQITLWPFIDENISWNAGVTFSFDLLKRK